MVNTVCQLDKSLVSPETGPECILGMSVRVFPGEIKFESGDSIKPGNESVG